MELKKFSATLLCQNGVTAPMSSGTSCSSSAYSTGLRSGRLSGACRGPTHSVSSVLGVKNKREVGNTLCLLSASTEERDEEFEAFECSLRRFLSRFQCFCFLSRVNFSVESSRRGSLPLLCAPLSLWWFSCFSSSMVWRMFSATRFLTVSSFSSLSLVSRICSFFLLSSSFFFVISFSG